MNEPRLDWDLAYSERFGPAALQDCIMVPSMQHPPPPHPPTHPNQICCVLAKWEPPSTILGATGTTKDYFGCKPSASPFSENCQSKPNHDNHEHPFFPGSVTSAYSRGNRVVSFVRECLFVFVFIYIYIWSMFFLA